MRVYLVAMTQAGLLRPLSTRRTGYYGTEPVTTGYGAWYRTVLYPTLYACGGVQGGAAFKTGAPPG
eukprot:305112-Hanusia_phi.AAC.2